MKTDRRQFLSTAVSGGLAATLPLSACIQSDSINSSPTLKDRYEMLDKILKQPVFRKELFSSPVIIETIELLRFENNFLCRVRSKDGAEGISVGHGVLPVTLTCY